MTDRTERIWKTLFGASQGLRDCATLLCKTRLDKITLAQERIFKVVLARSGGVKLKDIARELRLTPGAVSQSIDNLVREGLLERVVNPDDRRAVSIRTTAKLERHRRVNIKNFSRIIAAALDECSESESGAFVKVAEKIIEKARAVRAEIEAADDATTLKVTEETE